MALADDAVVQVFIADHVGIDGGGKLNALGAGFMVSGLQPTGLTSPQAIAVTIDVPSRYVGQDFTLSLELRNEANGSVVTVPGPSGSPEALRLVQLSKVERPNIPGLHLPPGVPTRVQVVTAFVNGLPLSLGTQYTWRVEIDSQHHKGWTATFYVPGPPPGPVFGGPAQPTDIPGFTPPSEVPPTT